MRGYQRKHLRAPFRGKIIYGHDGVVISADGVNISEGGVLVKNVPSFPESETALLFCLFHIPTFKDLSFDEVKYFEIDESLNHIFRTKCEFVRRRGSIPNLDELATNASYGVRFNRIDKIAESFVRRYIDNFVSNLIHLQMLIDNINDDQRNVERIQGIAGYLGYSYKTISELRTQVLIDYQNLQW